MVPIAGLALSIVQTLTKGSFTPDAAPRTVPCGALQCHASTRRRSAMHTATHIRRGSAAPYGTVRHRIWRTRANAWRRAPRSSVPYRAGSGAKKNEILKRCISAEENSSARTLYGRCSQCTARWRRRSPIGRRARRQIFNGGGSGGSGGPAGGGARGHYFRLRAAEFIDSDRSDPAIISLEMFSATCPCVCARAVCKIDMYAIHNVCLSPAAISSDSVFGHARRDLRWRPFGSLSLKLHRYDSLSIYCSTCCNRNLR